MVMMMLMINENNVCNIESVWIIAGRWLPFFLFRAKKTKVPRDIFSRFDRLRLSLHTE